MKIKERKAEEWCTRLMIFTCEKKRENKKTKACHHHVEVAGGPLPMVGNGDIKKAGVDVYTSYILALTER